ncbi:MAG: dimethyladenosine transferase [Acidimicrobiaceae bacterium]|nr:dimethyladenosine transferase [Acidimicrobiaceae bacterium]
MAFNKRFFGQDDSISENLGNSLYRVSRSEVIKAPQQAIFDLLSTPAHHHLFDGSGTVLAEVEGPRKLYLNAKFRMSMRRSAISYRIWNTVVEFDEPMVIAWKHVGRHIWRFRLEDRSSEFGPATLVTESFEWGDVYSKFLYEVFKFPTQNAMSIEATLGKLAELALNGQL